MMSTEALNATFSALADPTRRAILSRLASGEASVTELAEPFEMSLPAISKHLKVLERAGLIARGREAQWRPCRLEAAPLKAATDWLLSYQSFWKGSLDALESYLGETSGLGATAPGIDTTRPRGKKRAREKRAGAPARR